MKLYLSYAIALSTAASAFRSPAIPSSSYRTRTSSSSSTSARFSSSTAMLSQDELKKQVGYKAVDDYVKSGMVVGLGTGSTAYYAVERVGAKLKSGELTDILAIPTSVRTKEQAESLGIPLVTLDTHSKLDVAIDGADEVDPKMNLTKGGGGALFREKIVEVCATKFIVIVDESKIVKGLGPGFPIPVEIVPFCHEHTMRCIANLSTCQGKCQPVLRMGSCANNKVDGDTIAVTDNGNYIVDLHFTELITDPVTMGNELKNVVGVVEHGLFCNMASAVIIAGSDGIRVMEP
jgi:ribose 5-phosphate isomerase A